MGVRLQHGPVVADHREEGTGEGLGDRRGAHVVRGQRGEWTGRDVARWSYMGEASPGGDAASEELFIVGGMNQVSGTSGAVPNPQNGCAEAGSLLCGDRRTFVFAGRNLLDEKRQRAAAGKQRVDVLLLRPVIDIRGTNRDGQSGQHARGFEPVESAERAL